jgi:hypothetical protein
MQCVSQTTFTNQLSSILFLYMLLRLGSCSTHGCRVNESTNGSDVTPVVTVHSQKRDPYERLSYADREDSSRRQSGRLQSGRNNRNPRPGHGAAGASYVSHSVSPPRTPSPARKPVRMVLCIIIIINKLMPVNWIVLHV